ncbi:MAG: hypothetical protein ABJF10_03105 [Chthoniobacter sp.]|uniref:hypothetical protein n=1 Tax=Chthoniobacter sp. TaxID=2510640 RepID=UPI0032A64BEB
MWPRLLSFPSIACVVVLLMTLTRQGMAEEDKPAAYLAQRVLSPTKSFVLELRGKAKDWAPELWITSRQAPARRRLIFDFGRPISSAEFTKDERYIVVFWGGGALGQMVAVLERTGRDEYEFQKGDIPILAWKAYRRASHLGARTDFITIYCGRVAIENAPAAVVFSLRGDHDAIAGRQTQFGPVYYRYLLEQRKLTIIPRPLRRAD